MFIRNYSSIKRKHLRKAQDEVRRVFPERNWLLGEEVAFMCMYNPNYMRFFSEHITAGDEKAAAESYALLNSASAACMNIHLITKHPLGSELVAESVARFLNAQISSSCGSRKDEGVTQR